MEFSATFSEYLIVLQMTDKSTIQNMLSQESKVWYNYKDIGLLATVVFKKEV